MAYDSRKRDVFAVWPERLDLVYAKEVAKGETTFLIEEDASLGVAALASSQGARILPVDCSLSAIASSLKLDHGVLDKSVRLNA